MNEPTEKTRRLRTRGAISRKYERKLERVNSSFRMIMHLVDTDAVAALKATHKTLRAVLMTLLGTDHWDPKRTNLSALWVMAKSSCLLKRPREWEDNATDSLLKGLAWIEHGMLMELNNQTPRGTHYWSSINGIDYPITPFDARLIALVAHLAAIYILEVAEDNEDLRLCNGSNASTAETRGGVPEREASFTEDDIPF